VPQLTFEQGTSRTHITYVTASANLFCRSHEETTGCSRLRTLLATQAKAWRLVRKEELQKRRRREKHKNDNTQERMDEED
jgi:hypothetical protein